MAKITYSTGINKNDTIFCAATISNKEKQGEFVGKKYSTMKDFSVNNTQELFF